ncbi:MAG: hypothetical protein MJ185_03285 [Treponema sp.]|nr:hypothetical protein [Treponema sp.]
MADNDEVSIIAHLLEVEKEASKIISGANIKADKEISDAKISADAEFKKNYAERAEVLEKDFQTKKAVISSEHDKILQDYKTSVAGMTQNKEAFASVIEKELFGQE